jgi:hypothetical protein
MFEEPFTLRINETSYNVQPSSLFTSHRPARDILSDVSNSVTKLYHDLRLNQYVTYRERELENQLAYLRETVQPLNELHHQLANKAIRRLKWFVIRFLFNIYIYSFQDSMVDICCNVISNRRFISFSMD